MEEIKETLFGMKTNQEVIINRLSKIESYLFTCNQYLPSQSTPVSPLPYLSTANATPTPTDTEILDLLKQFDN